MAAPPGRHGGAVQGAEHVQQLGRDAPTAREIGRAQAMQAAACGLAPERRDQPGAAQARQRPQQPGRAARAGRSATVERAATYGGRKAALLDTVARHASPSCGPRFDVVICEGAGSPAEINLRRHDIVNMGLARAAGLPVVVVGDIDRGGVFAALFGTVAAARRRPTRRWSPGSWSTSSAATRAARSPASTCCAALTGRPTFGVCPGPTRPVARRGGLALRCRRRRARPAGAAARQRVAAGGGRAAAADVQLHRRRRAGRRARRRGPLVDRAAELADADLVVLPGTKATVDDLGWLRRTGLADAVARARAARAGRCSGICGGYQMLGRAHRRRRRREPRRRRRGLGLLAGRDRVRAEQDPRPPVGHGLGEPVRGYEIHHGRVARGPATPPLLDGDGLGAPAGRARHPLARRCWRPTGSAGRSSPGGRARRAAGFVGRAGHRLRRAARGTQLDLLGDLVEEHLDTDALGGVIEHGAPAGAAGRSRPLWQARR